MLRKTVTENGAVRGIPAADPRITVFKGVPFAAPPVGNLRWRAPQPALNWEGERVCDTFGPISMQATPGGPGDFYSKEWHVDPEIPMGEDCLYLNIWTPAKATDEKLPVMVWIFGGGMTCGYTAEMEFDGERIARRGVVLVSVNYRVNSFGFLAHPEITAEAKAHGEVAANFGLLDQRAGIQWVKRNIASFGGDPENITVFGQSAGGRSTWMQSCSPMNKGLFGKAIAQSGGLGGGIASYPDLAGAEKFGEGFLEYLGVKSVEEARQIPARELMDKTTAYTGHRWGPCIDGQFLTMSPLRAVAEGRMNDVRMMAGNTAGESRGRVPVQDVKDFAAWAEKTYGEDAQAFLDAAQIDTNEKMTAYFNSPAFSMFERGNSFAARCMARNGRPPMYLYRFDPEIPGDNAGSFHSSELWFVFETLAKCWRPFKGKHYDLARQMCNYWTNFAKTGDPNGPDNDGAPMPQWQSAKEGDWHVQFLGDEIHDCNEELSAVMGFEMDKLQELAQKE